MKVKRDMTLEDLELDAHLLTVEIDDDLSSRSNLFRASQADLYNKKSMDEFADELDIAIQGLKFNSATGEMTEVIDGGASPLNMDHPEAMSSSMPYYSFP